jgi:type VI secretion system protein
MSIFDKFSYDRRSGREDRLLQDIVDNLNNILNTKRGFGSFLDEFGIADMNEYRSREHMAHAVMLEVRRNIELYEPRVELVDITLVKDGNPMRLSFRIDCAIRKNAQSLHMVFDSALNSFLVDNP